MGKQSITDAMIFHAAELFLDRRARTVEEISDELNTIILDMQRRGDLEGKVPLLNRANVYRLIRQARDRGFIQLVPPVERRMSERLSQAFDRPSDRLTVVDTLGRTGNEQVSARAAEVTLDLLKEEWAKVRAQGKSGVTVGLGPGRGTLDFCRHLGRLLEAELSDLQLRLVAISAGAPALQPEYASSSFYNLFPAGRVVERVGLFAETLVACSDFKKIQGRPGISEAFREKNDDNIDVVVTSMGDLADREDLLGAFLEQARTNGFKINKTLGTFLEKKARLVAAGQDTSTMEMIASVQYRPYTNTGPIDERKDRDELRACTLFELADFVEMVKRGRHVILIARQCGACGMTRARGLYPLVKHDHLKVWSHIVMDVATSKELLSMAT
jgi:hypothetical protein